MKYLFIGIAIATVTSTGAFAKTKVDNDCKIAYVEKKPVIVHTQAEHKPWYTGCKENTSKCLVDTKK